MRTSALVLASILFFPGCDWVKRHYKADNDLEQFVEGVIEDKSGIRIDLSPWEEIDKKEGKVDRFNEKKL